MPEIAREQIEPRLRQVSFFLPNRLGALRRAVNVLEPHDVRIGGISVLEASDHAVVRIVVNRPDKALEVLGAEGYGGCITEVLGVCLPAWRGGGVHRVLSVLVGAEVNLQYAYCLIIRHEGTPVLAVQVDDMDMAARVLAGAGITVVGQDQLTWDARG
jgi:hypothetical protein